MKAFPSHKCHSSPEGLIAASVFLLLVPLRWLVAMAVAAAVHELFHMAMLRFLKVPITGFYISVAGARIETGPLWAWQEILCAAAGPLGSFCMLFLRRVYPEIALCGLVQGLFNLLPIYPSDGGRILRRLLHMMLPHRAKSAEKWVKNISIFFLFLAFSFAAALFPRWFFVITGAGILIVLRSVRKIPCKDDPLALQ